MLKYLKAKKTGKSMVWYCVTCRAAVKSDEVWIDDRGPYCGKHGVRLKIKHAAENLLRGSPVTVSTG